MSEPTAMDVVEAVLAKAHETHNCGICGAADPDARPDEPDYHHQTGCPVPLAEMVQTDADERKDA